MEMGYWCDDQALLIEQRRLDAAQEADRLRIVDRQKIEVKQTSERYACIKPANSRWDNGWLISMTSIDGFEMVQYPSDRPFVLSRAEWDRLPESHPDRWQT
jgi:hypothetical protein